MQRDIEESLKPHEDLMMVGSQVSRWYLSLGECVFSIKLYIVRQTYDEGFSAIVIYSYASNNWLNK